MSMRVIKFRAWDGKEMMEMKTLFLDIKYKPEVKIMQFTGLYDKSGTDIFEGDVLAIPYITPFGDVTEVEDNDKRGSVIFENGAFCLKYPHHNTPLVDLCKIEEGEYISNYGNRVIISNDIIVEVIGNIHQNPDLLY